MSALVAPVGDWAVHGGCAPHPEPALWFSDRGSQEEAEAIQICQRCPVRLECLEHAIATGERFGIWGGLTVDQRAQVARKRGQLRGPQINHGTEGGYRAHRRAGEDACPACKYGHTVYVQGVKAGSAGAAL